ncbi:GAF domain-containing protein [Actinokineospora sp. NBRC 105648]|uniref:GAF domain-containing protein n=1 Tax=Actinokineospora sp. NBRC 105648 TaxID=3032206 RepID=UPI0024A16E4A|nr:GAF domain-containing protein [Actinokineospora sp. NBRC 105648]GLZ38202.1 GAF domain-containing protein [Actinokineospora sp. NBRC 105648]
MTYDGRARHRAELMAWIAAAAAETGAELSPDLLCEFARRRLAVDGVLLVVTIDAGAVATHATGPPGLLLAELELTSGEGPLTTAIQTSLPVLVPDLAAQSAVSRWPLLAHPPDVLGIAAVFAFPMALGAVHLGAFGAYCSAPRPLSERALTEAAVFARIAMELVTADTAPLTSPQIHQATGMIAVQLGTDVSAAFARLRARAFVEGRGLAELASEVVARRVRFTPDDDNRARPGQGGASL